MVLVASSGRAKTGSKVVQVDCAWVGHTLNREERNTAAKSIFEETSVYVMNLWQILPIGNGQEREGKKGHSVSYIAHAWTPFLP